MPDRTTETAPCPPRLRLPLWRIAFGLLGAPVAWSTQLVATASAGGLACPASSGPLFWPASLTGPALLSVNLLALTVAGTALAVSYSDVRRTGAEPGTTTGRSRFLSAGGVWISLMFMFATLISTVSLLMRGTCPV